MRHHSWHFPHIVHIHRSHRDRKDHAWYQLHASEILVEPEPAQMVELLRFLSNDPHTFNRLRDTIIYRAYSVLDALERLEYAEPPTGTSYNKHHHDDNR
jgi:hypothetical protein